ncbi:hypothetical protein M3Y98_00875500 [Aphelenchoides besseyi]|nr:hypothetical protein M3Y98_00875500 [Aphelenchoides besseyi]KAI6195001.1 hypothetical protein M3Y96_01184800 [Aphelenchoides besseyi]
MCTFIGQFLYCSAMLISLALTLSATLFTSEWSKLTNATNDQVVDDRGLLDFRCHLSDLKACANGFGRQDTWRKAVVLAILVAIVFQVVAIFWTLCTVFTCCFRRHLLHPLSAFAFFAAVALIVALGVFYARYSEDDREINAVDQLQLIEVPEIHIKTRIGYSFYLAIAALVATFMAIIFGGFLSCAHRRGRRNYRRKEVPHYHNAGAWSIA